MVTDNNSNNNGGIVARLRRGQQRIIQSRQQHAENERVERLREIDNLNKRLSTERETIKQKTELSKLRLEEAKTQKQLRSFTTTGKIAAFVGGFAARTAKQRRRVSRAVPRRRTRTRVTRAKPQRRTRARPKTPRSSPGLGFDLSF